MERGIMDSLISLSNVLAVIETGALVVAMIFMTRGMHEKKNQRKQQGKNGGRSNEITQKAVAASYRSAGISLFIYLALNILRKYSGIFG